MWIIGFVRFQNLRNPRFSRTFFALFPGVFQGYLKYTKKNPWDVDRFWVHKAVMTLNDILIQKKIPETLTSFWVYKAVMTLNDILIYPKKCWEMKKCILDIVQKSLFNLSFWIVLHSLGMILYSAQSLSFPGFSRNKFRIPWFSRVF